MRGFVLLGGLFWATQAISQPLSHSICNPLFSEGSAGRPEDLSSKQVQLQIRNNLCDRLVQIPSSGDSGAVELTQATQTEQEIQSLQRRLVARVSELEKRVSSLAQSIPAGTIAFFNLRNCPESAGWFPLEALRGRYIVGVPNDNPGSVGRLVGRSLGDGENRPTGAHTHTSNQVIMVAPGGQPNIAEGGPRIHSPNSPTSGANAVADPQFSGALRADVPGTNAPYVQYLACIRR
jgi:hypothetical protein